VDPERVRQARVDAGLSLAQLAGDDVSRTFLHFVEHGRSRPSRHVLALIARRTGKPMSYFISQPPRDTQPTTDLTGDLTRVANHVRQFSSLKSLTTVERETMKLIELTLRQAAELTKTVQANAHRNRKTRA